MSMRKMNSPFVPILLDSPQMTNTHMKESFARRDSEFYQHKERKSNYKNMTNI